MSLRRDMLRSKNFFLIKQLAFTDFKMGYKGSLMGFLWPVLNPLLRFCILFMVFSVFLRFDMQYYNLYLLLGIITWNFLSESTNYSMQALLSKAPIIKNINFDRYVIIIASFMASSISFLISFLLFLVFWSFSDIKFSMSMLWTFPYFLTLFIWCLGLSFSISAVVGRFKDIRHIWNILLQLFFWLTPIVYPLKAIPERFRCLFALNPFYHIIDGLRMSLIYSTNPSVLSYVIITLIGLAVLLIGFKLYSKLSKYFPEHI